MVEQVGKKTLSIREQAELEIRKERQEAALYKMKTKLKELLSAQRVVANLEREIDELQQDIDAGIE